MGRARELAGPASVGLYLAALVAIQVTGWPHWETLAASPDHLAGGRVWLLLSSGLVIAGEPWWAQFAVLAVVLMFALVRLGAARLWAVGLTAHVGAALIAYLGVLVLWLVDPARPDVDEADYGISVLLAGELGALAATGGRRTALAVGALAIVGFGVGLEGASWLANAEHVLGFAIGAAVGQTGRLSWRPCRR